LPREEPKSHGQLAVQRYGARGRTHRSSRRLSGALRNVASPCAAWRCAAVPSRMRQWCRR
jgi:hypothetical protein